MQTLSLKLSKKLYEIMPEVLKDCENWWMNLPEYNKECVRNKYHVSSDNKYKICPAPTIADILSAKFIAEFIMKYYPEKLTESKIELLSNSLVEGIAFAHIDNGIPAVEQYLWELIGDKNDKQNRINLEVS